VLGTLIEYTSNKKLDSKCKEPKNWIENNELFCWEKRIGEKSLFQEFPLHNRVITLFTNVYNTQ
jgi:hypothetical protein